MNYFLLFGIIGVVLFALLIWFFAPKPEDRRGSGYVRGDKTPLAATRLAEETHHAARVGAASGAGLLEGGGPFTGTLPREKDKK